MMWARYTLIAALALLAQIGLAPAASADCTTAGNTTVCSMGGLDDEDTGPYTPYPCRYDYYCNDDWGWFIP